MHTLKVTLKQVCFKTTKHLILYDEMGRKTELDIDANLPYGGVLAVIRTLIADFLEQNGSITQYSEAYGIALDPVQPVVIGLIFSLVNNSVVKVLGN